MAKGLYIGSTAGYSGKNMIVMGLGLRLKKEGYRVGYMKPVGAMPKEVGGKAADEDALFIQEVLGLSQDPALTTPVVVTHDFKIKAFTGKCEDFMPAIEEAYATLSEGKDVMLIGGSGSMYSGRYCGLDGVTVVKKLGLKSLVIDRMRKELDYDFLVVLKDVLGEALLGAILNDIPQNFMNEVKTLIEPFLNESGVKVVGVIPRDPLMGAIKVGDLAERLGGKIITAHTKSDKVVENFLIGTMQVENFMTHFKKAKNAAVIVGGDRSDVQLVALEGGCPCLVLTGNLYPNDIIMTRSEVLSIPIIVVREDTFSVAKKMEAILTRHKLRAGIKIQQGAQLVSSSCDVEYLKREIGL